MENKNSIYNLMDKLPIEVQRIIDSFWSWKNYYTDNIIYHLNYDLSINHFIEKVTERKIIDCPYLSNEQKNKYHYHRSFWYFLHFKDYVFDINEKIKKVVNDKALLKFYRKKCEWMRVINTSYYDNVYIIEKIKYYSYMILSYNYLKTICIYQTLRFSFSDNNLTLHRKKLHSYHFLHKFHPSIRYL